MWISKEWLIEVMTSNKDIDFNNFTRADLIQMLNMLRLSLYERIENGEIQYCVQEDW